MNSFGQRLREWRKASGKSQLELALSADVSGRHLSFLETGRSLPSRGMVRRLALSAGKNDSIQSSCNVISWGVPNVAIVLNQLSDW